MGHRGRSAEMDRKGLRLGSTTGADGHLHVVSGCGSGTTRDVSPVRIGERKGGAARGGPRPAKGDVLGSGAIGGSRPATEAIRSCALSRRGYGRGLGPGRFRVSGWAGPGVEGPRRPGCRGPGESWAPFPPPHPRPSGVERRPGCRVPSSPRAPRALRTRSPRRAWTPSRPLVLGPPFRGTSRGRRDSPLHAWRRPRSGPGVVCFRRGGARRARCGREWRGAAETLSPCAGSDRVSGGVAPGRAYPRPPPGPSGSPPRPARPLRRTPGLSAEATQGLRPNRGATADDWLRTRSGDPSRVPDRGRGRGGAGVRTGTAPFGSRGPRPATGRGWGKGVKVLGLEGKTLSPIH